MKPWMKCAGLVGVMVATLFLYAAGAAAFSYQAAEDLPFRVSLEDLKLAKMPATPQFFMKSLGGEYYPVTVLEAKAGENSILCKVQQKVPPGSYALFFQKKDRLFQLRKTLRILAPVIQQITIDHSKVADGNMVVLDGLYLGRQRKALPIARGDLQGAPHAVLQTSHPGKTSVQAVTPRRDDRAMVCRHPVTTACLLIQALSIDPH